ncbi:hypothetical protein OO012_11175 [Rhodobacteraceae bacterium KMM 6894]|nr:hypothetical protein [Rhodobacteraceae bacterium KMM 6894]
MPRPKRIILHPCKIIDDDRFSHRTGRISNSHVDTLCRTLRGKRNLDPIWVWQEVDGNGETTGSLVLMDGRHRTAAYEQCFERFGHERYLQIPAHIFEGSEITAALKALALNSRDKLALSLSEKLDAAWKIVSRDTANEATKPMIAAAAGISQRTVLNMRNKRNAIIEAGDQLPDTWFKARIWPEETEWTPPTDDEREGEIAKLRDAFQEAIRLTRSRDVDIIAEAFGRALGQPNTSFAVDYLRGHSDDEYDEFDDENDRETEVKRSCVADEHSDF